MPYFKDLPPTTPTVRELVAYYERELEKLRQVIDEIEQRLTALEPPSP